MQVNIDITIGKGDKAKTTQYSVDSDDLPLILLEAFQEGRAKEMREGVAEFLGLAAEEARALTLRHIKAISEALVEASKSPNV